MRFGRVWRAFTEGKSGEDLASWDGQIERVSGVKIGDFSLIMRAEGDPVGARVVKSDPLSSGSLVGKDICGV